MMKLVLRRGFDAVGRIDGGRVGNCKVDRGRGGGEEGGGGGREGSFHLGRDGRARAEEGKMVDEGEGGDSGAQ